LALGEGLGLGDSDPLKQVTSVPDGLKYAKPAAEFPPLITELLAKVPAAP